jgi:Rad3-related DNA helicase
MQFKKKGPQRNILDFSDDGVLKVPEGAVSKKGFQRGWVKKSRDGSPQRVSKGFGSAAEKLKTSKDLEIADEKIEGFAEKDWALTEEGKILEPLQFSNGKTQADVVSEVKKLIEDGTKVVFIEGVCGSGKSAMALHLARELGKASLVVPVKALQRQYEEDYCSGGKKIVGRDGKPLKIAMITGRENHDSVIQPGVSCADPRLPDTVKLIEKNAALLREFYEDNPLIQAKHDVVDWKQLKRMSVAPANPYWSPIVGSEIELKQLSDATPKKYRGLNGREFVFYHRKKGCSYFDQYQAYFDADVLVFNAAKYLIEVALDRKPATKIDIIDEADAFLDSFATQQSLDLTRLAGALRSLVSESPEVRGLVDEALEMIRLDEQRVRTLGLVHAGSIVPFGETLLRKVFAVLGHQEVEADILVDEQSYGNHALEVVKSFAGALDQTFVRYAKEGGFGTDEASSSDASRPRTYDRSGGEGESLVAELVTTHVAEQFALLAGKVDALVLMSGTLHSKDVLEDVYGIKEYAIVQAETQQPGTMEIVRTGKEFDCKWRDLKDRRQDYVEALRACVLKADRPTLVQVHAYEDLPSAAEKDGLGVQEVIHREALRDQQNGDKTGRLVSLFKSGMNDLLFSTKCSRGVDFPGEQCRSVIFTKYPNPNVRGVFWQVLEKTHPDQYWSLYRDKAHREFVQRLSRALRKKDDFVRVLSPDLRVLTAVQELQRKGLA